MTRFPLRFALGLVCLNFGTTTFAREQNPVPQFDVTIELSVKDTNSAAQKIDEILRRNGVRIEKRTQKKDYIGFYSVTFAASIQTAVLDRTMDALRNIGNVRNESLEIAPSAQSLKMKILIIDEQSLKGRQTPIQGRLFAGVAAASLGLSLGGVENNRTMTGAGITLSPRGRWAQLTILTLKETTTKKDADADDSSNPSAAGSSILMIGHNYYSSIMGSGGNTYMNPFAGVSYGYSRLFSSSLFTVGGTIGLELVKWPWLTWSISSNFMGFYSSRNGGTATMYATHLFIPF